MRLNTAKSIETANDVHARYGSWKAAREAARFQDGKFILSGKSAPRAKAK